MLDSQTQRLDRAADKLMSDLRDLQKAQDGTEIKSRKLEVVSEAESVCAADNARIGCTGEEDDKSILVSMASGTA